MTDWAIDHGDVRIACGDAVDQLATMPDRSVQCIVTSPPFWALRDYQTGRWEGGDEGCDHQPPKKAERKFTNGRGEGDGDGYAGTNLRSWTSRDGTPYGKVCGRCGAVRVDQQIGLEETPEEWVEALVRVFRECRRVLRDDGVMWVEVGDTYASTSTYRAPQTIATKNGWKQEQAPVPRPKPQGGIKPKDMVGAPWMLGLALRADGWWLRDDVIWRRPNPMPSSARDRTTKAHSYVLLLSKSATYFYDPDAIREEPNPESIARYARSSRYDDQVIADAVPYAATRPRGNPQGANRRSVWDISTDPTTHDHFATFPRALVERCIKAGTSEHGACATCGAPWRRVVEATGGMIGQSFHDHADDLGIGAGQGTHGHKEWSDYQRVFKGWEPTCTCHGEFVTETTIECYGDDGEPILERTLVYRSDLPIEDHPRVPQVVLDPFMGSGTTAFVARALARHAIGVELNPDYLRIADEKLKQLSLLG